MRFPAIYDFGGHGARSPKSFAGPFPVGPKTQARKAFSSAHSTNSTHPKHPGNTQLTPGLHQRKNQPLVALRFSQQAQKTVFSSPSRFSPQSPPPQEARKGPFREQKNPCLLCRKPFCSGDSLRLFPAILPSKANRPSKITPEALGGGVKPFLLGLEKMTYLFVILTGSQTLKAAACTPYSLISFKR